MATPRRSFYEAAWDILRRLGAPLRATSVNLLVSWEIVEKGWQGDAWQWNNPLNTTVACCGWTGNANRVGVKIYPTHEAGVEATVRTLLNGRYPTLVQALRTGNVSLFFSPQGARELRVWATGNPDAPSQYASAVQGVYRNLPPPPHPPILPPWLPLPTLEWWGWPVIAFATSFSLGFVAGELVVEKRKAPAHP